jgi:hypothetical protein
LFIFFKNENKYPYEINLAFTELKNLKLRKPFRGTSVLIRIEPGHEEVLMLKRTDFGLSYNYKLSIRRL